ncbi:MAG: Hsp20/alpha crystallin family protein [Cyanobacteria bacterium HKST-UBA02]|nr:Hsp20/alpha crystallin family protein [Cyanobacteria bacterium HKST-UBA02]
MAFNNLVPWSRKSVPARKSNQDYSHPMLSLQSEMNKLFENFFSGDDEIFGTFGLSPSLSRGSFDPLMPRADVSESEKELLVSLELPGISEEDVLVSLADNVLTISGEKKQESKTDEKGWYRMERHYGSFSRTIPLPCEVEDDKVDACFKNGVLTIKMPKARESVRQAKKITVRKG